MRSRTTSGGGVPDGYRDRVLFVMSLELSWFTHPDSLHDEILATPKMFTPALEECDVSTLMAR
jgi:hypothetical protein